MAQEGPGEPPTPRPVRGRAQDGEDPGAAPEGLARPGRGPFGPGAGGRGGERTGGDGVGVRRPVAPTSVAPLVAENTAPSSKETKRAHASRTRPRGPNAGPRRPSV